MEFKQHTEWQPVKVERVVAPLPAPAAADCYGQPIAAVSLQCTHSGGFGCQLLWGQNKKQLTSSCSLSLK